MRAHPTESITIDLDNDAAEQMMMNNDSGMHYLQQNVQPSGNTMAPLTSPLHQPPAPSQVMSTRKRARSQDAEDIRALLSESRSSWAHHEERRLRIQLESQEKTLEKLLQMERDRDERRMQMEREREERRMQLDKEHMQAMQSMMSAVVGVIRRD